MAKKAKETKSIRTSVSPTPASASAALGTPAAKPARKTQELQVVIDYPQQDEGISSDSYSLRVGTAPAAEKVEVSIDRGPWLACRPAEGYWWYDWSNFAPGVHRVTARALTAEGDSGISAQRRVQVLKP